jgi:hypothetical protein
MDKPSFLINSLDLRIGQKNKLQQLTDFRNRLVIVLKDFQQIWAIPEVDKSYRFVRGYQENSAFRDIYHKHTFGDHAILNDICSATSINEIKTALQYFFQVFESFGTPTSAYKLLIDSIITSIKLSQGINIELAVSDSSVLVYDAEESFLETEAVNTTLQWLSLYPDVSRPFEQAIAMHDAKNSDTYRNLLDNLRVAMEQLLRVVLHNKKSFENQQGELEAWLKQHGVNTYIITMYNYLLFNPYSNFQNNSVKHKRDEWVPSQAEIEFFIYLTGTFMRLLLQLNQETPHEQ